jgi:NhaP-type Na+/H+ or K+/H+ antiporter
MSKPLQKIIVAESGANDGLGYLFLFLPLYLFKYAGEVGGTGKAVSSFLSVTCLYTVLLSVVYGAAAGWAAKHALFWAKRRRLVDRECFHLFVIALAVSVSICIPRVA